VPDGAVLSWANGTRIDLDSGRARRSRHPDSRIHHGVTDHAGRW